MPATINTNQTIVATPQEFDSSNNPVTIVPAHLVWNTNNPSIATVEKQPDGSGKFTAVGVGTCLASVSDTAFNLSFQDTLTVTQSGSDPTVLNFTWGTPQP